MSKDQYQPGADSLSFPDDTVVGIVDDPDAADAAIQDLIASGIPEEGIHVRCCEAGAERLDPHGKRHGALGRLKRLVQLFGDQEIPHLERQASELREGSFLIAAPADEDEREKVADVLRAQGGHFINHYGKWAVTRLDD